MDRGPTCYTFAVAARWRGRALLRRSAAVRRRACRTGPSAPCSAATRTCRRARARTAPCSASACFVKCPMCTAFWATSCSFIAACVASVSRRSTRRTRRPWTSRFWPRAPSLWRSGTVARRRTSAARTRRCTEACAVAAPTSCAPSRRTRSCAASHASLPRTTWIRSWAIPTMWPRAASSITTLTPPAWSSPCSWRCVTCRSASATWWPQLALFGPLVLPQEHHQLPAGSHGAAAAA